MKRIAALLASVLFAACALAQVPIYTRPAAATVTAASIATAQGGEDSLTAFATGGQTNATALSSTVTNHRVSTVATTGDSVKLPAATVGQVHYVRNDGATPMQVFGQATETIDGVASATGVVQLPGVGVFYTSTTAGAWTSSFNPSRIAAGTASVQSLTFAGDTFGWYRGGPNQWATGSGGGGSFLLGVNIVTLASGSVLGWTSGAINAATDLTLVRDAANTLAQKNSTTAQVRRLYFSTTGPVYLQETARAAGALYTGVGGAAQVSYSQTTVPTCSASCGTSPSVVGSDTAMKVTMGASGVPASPFTITFNGTWPAAPSCVVTSNTAQTTRYVTAAVTSTTTISVTTAAAPSTSDVFNVICHGVS